MKKYLFSYRSKLFLLVTIITWMIIAVFVVFSFTRDKQYRTDLLNSQLQATNESMLAEHQKGKSWSELVQKHPEIRISVLDFEGNVIYDTNEIRPSDNHSDRSEIKQAVSKGSGYTVRRPSSADKKDYFYSATKGDNVIIRSAVPYDVSLSNTLEVDYVYLHILIIIGIVATLLAWVTLGRATQSIKTLRDFAVNIEKDKNFNPDDYSFPNDELGEISDEIVNLYKKLQKSNVDADNTMSQLAFEEQEKVRIKHQMSANISHELKNPIHAINACLETLSSNYDKLDNETIKDLVQKSLDQSDRLVALVNDLSLITRLNDGYHQIELSKINVSDIVNKIANEVELLPIEKRMRVHVNIASDIQIDGNESLIESIFRNLITNSLDYSGGRDIFIETTKFDDKEVVFKFADNGIGVSSEHLDKIFERFYRPDEGRNRKQGGTGLGLSIVRNSVHFHGGEINVSNREGGGLEFNFSFAIHNSNNKNS